MSRNASGRVPRSPTRHRRPEKPSQIVTAGFAKSSRQLVCQAIVHASVPGKMLVVEVASTVSHVSRDSLSGSASVKPSSQTPDASVRPALANVRSDASTSSTCSCTECLEAYDRSPATRRPTSPPLRTQAAPERRRRTGGAQKSVASTGVAVRRNTSRRDTARSYSSRPQSVPPARRFTPGSQQAAKEKERAPIPNFERSNTEMTMSETNSVRSQQGSVVTAANYSKDVFHSENVPATAPDSPVTPAISISSLLKYGSFHPIHDRALWRAKHERRDSPPPPLSSDAPAVPVIRISGATRTPRRGDAMKMKKSSGSSAGVSSTAASTMNTTSIPDWVVPDCKTYSPPRQTRRAQATGVHTSAYLNYPTKASRMRDSECVVPDDTSSEADLEKGVEACLPSPTDLKAAEEARLEKCATKLKFSLALVVTILFLLTALALYHNSTAPSESLVTP